MNKCATHLQFIIESVYIEFCVLDEYFGALTDELRLQRKWIDNVYFQMIARNFLKHVLRNIFLFNRELISLSFAVRETFHSSFFKILQVSMHTSSERIHLMLQHCSDFERVSIETCVYIT